MMKPENEVRQKLIDALNGQIEAVETNDESQFLMNAQRVQVLADILYMNCYARDYVYKKNGGAE